MWFLFKAKSYRIFQPCRELDKQMCYNWIKYLQQTWALGSLLPLLAVRILLRLETYSKWFEKYVYWYIVLCKVPDYFIHCRSSGAVGESVRLTSESWVFESQPRKTLVVKTYSDSSTAKRSSLGGYVKVPRRWPL